MPGYQYKDGTTVTAQVGCATSSSCSPTTTAATARPGCANAADEARLIDAMQARPGSSSSPVRRKRGTVTHDTYSLAGLSDALDKIHDACGM